MAQTHARSPHQHSIEDMPIGRGQNKLVTTNVLAETANTLYLPSGAKITGYSNTISGILAPDGTPATNVQDAIDGLAQEGWLAPNEYWVDNTLVAVSGRKCPSLDDVWGIADPTLGAIIVRCREGQTHLMTTAPAGDQDVTIYAEGQIIGELTDPTVAGQINMVGVVFASLGLSAIFARFEVRGLCLEGTMTGHPGWAFKFVDCSFNGFGVTSDQDAALLGQQTYVFEGCNDNPFAAVKTLTILTTDHTAAGEQSQFRFNKCELTPEVTAAKTGPMLSIGRARATFDQCTFQFTLESPGIGAFSTVAAGALLFFTGCTGNLDAEVGTTLFGGSWTQLSTDLKLVSRSSNDVNLAGVMLTGSQQGDITLVTSDLPVGIGAGPTLPPGGSTNDSTLTNASYSGLTGPGSPSWMDGEGNLLAPGSHFYGTLSTSGAATAPIEWFAAQGSQTNIIVGTNRVVRYTLEVFARQTNATGSALFTFEGLLQDEGGVLTQVDGPNKVAVVQDGGLVASDADVTVNANDIQIDVTGGLGTQTVWRARMVWLVVG